MEQISQRRSLRDRRTLKSTDFYTPSVIQPPSKKSQENVKKCLDDDVKPLTKVVVVDDKFVATKLVKEVKIATKKPAKEEKIVENEKTIAKLNNVVADDDEPKKKIFFNLDENFNPVVLLTKCDDLAVKIFKEIPKEIEDIVVDSLEIDRSSSNVYNRSFISCEGNFSRSTNAPSTTNVANLSLISNISTPIDRFSIANAPSTTSPFFSSHSNSSQNYVNFQTPFVDVRSNGSITAFPYGYRVPHPIIFQKNVYRSNPSYANEFKKIPLVKRNYNNCRSSFYHLRSPYESISNVEHRINEQKTAYESVSNGHRFYAQKPRYEQISSNETQNHYKQRSDYHRYHRPSYEVVDENRRLPPLTCPICWEIYFEADDFESHYRLMHNYVYLEEFGRVPCLAGPFRPSKLDVEDDAYVPQTDVPCKCCFQKNINCSGTYSLFH